MCFIIIMLKQSIELQVDSKPFSIGYVKKLNGTGISLHIETGKSIKDPNRSGSLNQGQTRISEEPASMLP